MSAERREWDVTRDEAILIETLRRCDGSAASYAALVIRDAWDPQEHSWEAWRSLVEFEVATVAVLGRRWDA